MNILDTLKTYLAHPYAQYVIIAVALIGGLIVACNGKKLLNFFKFLICAGAGFWAGLTYLAPVVLPYVVNYLGSAAQYGAYIVGGVVAYCIFSFVALLFYDGPVRDLLVYMCTASIKWPGLVYTFDKDGFLWVIAVKSLFVVISFIFGLLCGILGIALGLIISPFVFPYKLIKMSYDIRHADLTDYVS